MALTAQHTPMKDEKFSVDKGKNPPTQPLRENVSDETYNSSHLKNICVLEKQKRARAKTVLLTNQV
jgi:hypothetical protein